ncbi:MAG: hypothetical protein ACFBSD_10285 [Paracoccaceae bacterium]
MTGAFLKRRPAGVPARQEPPAVAAPPAMPAPPNGPSAADIPLALPARRGTAVPWAALVSFLLMVAVPGGAIGYYYSAIAADQYVSKARFVLHEIATRPLSLAEGAAEPADLGTALSFARVSDLTHVAVSYARSPGLIAELEARLPLRRMFRRPEADQIARLGDDASAEDVTAYWRNRVTAAVDGPSGIVRLSVRAFRPEDAERLASATLARIEALVNGLALRRKKDALGRARKEAAEAERRLTATLAELTAYRDAEGLVSPDREADATVAVLTELTAERIRLANELRVLEEMGAGRAARGRALETRLATVNADIAALRDTVASAATADRNLASALGRYEALEIRRRFAATLYGIAQARVIDAELDLARQSIYVNVYDPPLRPEDPSYPARLSFTVLGILALFVGWSILRLIWASVEDHRLS